MNCLIKDTDYELIFDLYNSKKEIDSLPELKQHIREHLPTYDFGAMRSFLKEFDKYGSVKV